MTISECNEPVPSNIRRIIKDKGLKQYAVAQKAGMTASNLTDMLKGRKIIKVSDILALSTALDVGIPDFFQPLRALAYVFSPNVEPEALFNRWEQMRKEEYASRTRKAPPVRMFSPVATAPSGTVDLCMTDGEEVVRFDEVDAEEAVRRFRDFLTGEILPRGGGAVFVSCAVYPKAETGKE